MLRIRSLLHLLPQLVRTMFSRPSTVGYPFRPLELPDYFRGRVVVDADACKGCGACVRDCPSTGLKLERVSKTHFRIVHYPDRGAYCGQCETSCPSGAIHLVSDYVKANPVREELEEVLVDLVE